MCCAGRKPKFENREVATRLIEILAKHAETHMFAVHAYCVMPDHFHFLAAGLREESSAHLQVGTFEFGFGFGFDFASDSGFVFPFHCGTQLSKGGEIAPNRRPSTPNSDNRAHAMIAPQPVARAGATTA
jgi:hypothetical protein